MKTEIGQAADISAIQRVLRRIHILDVISTIHETGLQ